MMNGEVNDRDNDTRQQELVDKRAALRRNFESQRDERDQQFRQIEREADDVTQELSLGLDFDAARAITRIIEDATWDAKAAFNIAQGQLEDDFEESDENLKRQEHVLRNKSDRA
jgi:hypothetical protein